MTTEEVIELIEEALEVEQNCLKLETKLIDIEEYDSMGKLSIIVLMDEEFNKRLNGERISEFVTISDIVEFAQS